MPMTSEEKREWKKEYNKKYYAGEIPKKQKKQLSDEEKKAKKREYNKRYRSTEHGKDVTIQNLKKYRTSDKYLEYQRKYYMKKKEHET